MRTPTTPTLTLLQLELIAKGKVRWISIFSSEISLQSRLNLKGVVCCYVYKRNRWKIQISRFFRRLYKHSWAHTFGNEKGVVCSIWLRRSFSFSSPHRANMITVLLCSVLPIARLCVWHYPGYRLRLWIRNTKISLEFYCALNYLPKVWTKLNMKQQHPGLRFFYCDCTTVQKERN